ncbi:mechanosensitive ion channel family protein [Roseateles sp. LYH14W]|uniref:Mechanosensitive ion channel domain-containing protein n=1 Tax=Pelomonas parva TaxID=3299032 RepID=A0ABW7F2Q5_9BURK
MASREVARRGSAARRLFAATVQKARWVAAAGLAAAVMASGAQQPATAAPGASGATAVASSPAPIVATEIVVRADQDQRLADRILRQAERTEVAERLSRELQAIEAPVEEKLRSFGAESLRELPVMRLESLERHWKFDAARFLQWQKEAQRAMSPFSNATAQLAQRRAVWRATQDSAVVQQLPAVLRERVDALQLALSAAEEALSAPLARQIEIGRRADTLDAQIQAGRTEVAEAIAAIDLRLLKIDAPPLWSLRLGDRTGSESSAMIERGMDIEGRFASAYAVNATGNKAALLIVQLLLLAVLAGLRYRSRLVPMASTDAASAQILRRPVSTWLLLAMMAVLAIERDAPLLALQVAMLVALVPLLRLLPAHRLPVPDAWPYLAIGLYALSRLGVVLIGNGAVFRLYHFALTVLALLVTLWFLQRARSQGPALTRAAAIARAAAWAAAVLLGLAALLNAVGNVSLAETLTSGVIDSGYSALLLYAAVAVARALLRVVGSDPAVQRLALVRRHGEALLSAATRGLALAAAFGWLVYAMNSFRVLRPVQSWLEAVLGHDFEVGEISLSLGNLLVFAVSVVVATWVARIVRQLLGEQLSARESLPRGVANSVASLSYYGLLLLGFLLALSAAGFKVSQLALVFGALGVGIGFGLQNIVNNFVSGLVLMVERPLRPGDIVDVAGVSGRVREIGLRATLIRTFEGADVVVPNGMLLTGSLTNWTLTDHSRRIEIEVPVAYGSDAAQVLPMLQAAAREVPGVAAEPAPAALLKGYGDSSLNVVLRVWTQDYDRWVVIRSELLTRVLAALADAGIQVPFNQVDLNVKTVSAEARDWLRPAPPPQDA